MKTILVATDFSVNATHAAEYGCQIAAQLHANLTLCNAFVVPAEVPDAGFVTWPLYEYEEMMKDSGEELKKLKKQLESSIDAANFRPEISCINEAGFVTDVVNSSVSRKEVKLVVAGTHGTNGLSEFIMGNHSNKLIEETICPLLLVPPTAAVVPIKKIAFATDFTDPEKDLECIYELIALVRPMNVEVLITYVHNDEHQSPAFKLWLDEFLVSISNKADYPNVYYRMVRNDNPNRGLEWLCEHGHIDILAMVHREHSFIGKLFNGSHTQKMARNISIPLLVMHQKK